MTKTDDAIHTLLFETSPYGNVDAIVEHDGRAVYFYLNGRDGIGTRACWVRNLVVGPLAFNQSDMESGISPVLPRIFCRKAEPGVVPRDQDLTILWLAEGNGAALFEGDELLAVIPPWSGQDQFHGYARDCASTNIVCWPLPSEPQLLQRIAASREFWNRWGENRLFAEIQSQQIELYEQRFGKMRLYFAIDGGKFPQRGMGEFAAEHFVYLATIGMSLCPQPNVELFVDNPTATRRIELGLRLPINSSATVVEQAAGLISGLAGSPWRLWSWFGHRHTCEFALSSTHKQAALLADSKLTAGSGEASPPGWGLPAIDGDPVNLLWVVPIDSQKFQRLRSGQWHDSDLAL